MLAFRDTRKAGLAKWKKKGNKSMRKQPIQGKGHVQKHQGLEELSMLRMCLAMFVVGTQDILWQRVGFAKHSRHRSFQKAKSNSMVGVHLWSLATGLAYFISCLKEGRKGPKIPITRGHLSEEHTVFFKDQLPEIPEDRDKDILSYVAHVPSKYLKRDNSECQEGMKWPHSHPW